MECTITRNALAAAIAVVLSFASTVHAQSAAPLNDVSARINTSSLANTGTYTRFIVRYRDETPTAPVVASQAAAVAMTRAAKLQSSLSVRVPKVAYKRTTAIGSHVITMSRKLSSSEATAFMQAMAADPTVAYVEPDVLRHAIGIKAPAAFVANDPLFAKYQTDYLPGDGMPTSAGNSVANWGGANITGAWNLADGSGVTIAVLDTGIVKHADIDTSLGDDGYDFTSDRVNSGRATDGRAAGGWDLGDWTTGAPYSSGPDACVDPDDGDDSSWHGTHVASATGAEITNNGIGLAGIAYKAKVLPVRVLGHDDGLRIPCVNGGSVKRRGRRRSARLHIKRHVARAAGGTDDQRACVGRYVDLVERLAAGIALLTGQCDAVLQHGRVVGRRRRAAKVATATTYYLRVVGVQAYAGVSVQATYTPASQ